MILSGTVAAADTVVVAAHRYELSGLLSFDSYENNFHTVNSIEFGLNWLGILYSGADLDVEFRNNSVKASGAVSTTFRWTRGRHEIRPGVCGGVRSLWVGSYSDKAPCAGFKGIYAYNVSPALSLRAEVKAEWFLEARTVFGTKALLGLCWGFGLVPPQF
jgi:hypothetical protein